MKLLDVNLLIYAVDEDSARFAQAHPWVEGVLGGRETVALDAHLAALAIEHGAELNSCDADFSRFAGLRWTDPLRAG